MAVKWFDEPEDHDYDAAADYLSMLAEDATVAATVSALKSAKPVYRKAKDILRAARLVLLPPGNAHVKADLAKIDAGKNSRRSCWCAVPRLMPSRSPTATTVSARVS